MALVLTRKENQSITFTTESGEIIQLAVSRLCRGQVSLCIDAPKAVRIVRTELLQKGLANNNKEKQHSPLS
ncbi:carbon storage regulator [Oceanicoccus sagamiensis]|uniref:Carbon storage regulator n=1 Tax=Oceanicoccus sagamiensis TaxID=716816 RepID=A0A1X9NGI8_9GAMM|nr:carbon storage regulator [Oceanicoccus sagamiensis]ARN74619.1 hypothetical protein BST96_11095 [Oceanicoccus sagamiensis]